MQGSFRLILLVALAPTAISQSVLHTFDGDTWLDAFGYSVGGAGDVNGDGFDDLIVGAPNDDNVASQSGNVRILSGLDGGVLYTLDGKRDHDWLGFSVSGAGDVNADGFADVIMGAIGTDKHFSSTGSVRVVSGVNGKVLYKFHGDLRDDRLGLSVSGAGDVNADGFDDLIAGLADNMPDGFSFIPGRARVFSGIDGSVLYTFEGDTHGDEFGSSVSGAGDVNADGHDDLIVGARYDDDNGTDSGSARVFSGLDGSVLYTWHGPSAGRWFGFSVSGAGDVNADGFADVIVGAPYWGGSSGTESGSVHVFSGVDGSLLHTFGGDTGGPGMGFSVAAAGDVNADGKADLVVGGGSGNDNIDSDSGIARVFCGATGRLIYTLRGDAAGDGFGFSVSGAGDVNADGFADLIVGALNADGAQSGSGIARVFSGCAGCGPIGQNYCGPANLNSSGLSARISAVGSATASQNAVVLEAEQLPLNVLGYFINSDVQGFLPFPMGSQGNLCLRGKIGRHGQQIASSGASGVLTINLDLTALPRPGGTHSVLAGETWNFQAWFRDKNPLPTSNFTDGVSIVFQ